MNCKQAQEWISRGMDGELSTTDRERLEQHLIQCPGCRQIQDHWMSASQLFKQTSQVKIPDAEETWQEIRSQLDQPEKTPRDNLLPFPSIIRWASAIAAVIAVSFGIRFVLQKPSLETHAFQNEVEFVESDIPDSSTAIYVDDESGWTIVWVFESQDLDEETT
jgi:predicted anti-sigma-YlaC factor YlaD